MNCPLFTSFSAHLLYEGDNQTNQATRCQHGARPAPAANTSVEAGQAQGEVSPRAAVNDDVERRSRLDGVPQHAASKQQHAAAQKQAAGRPAK